MKSWGKDFHKISGAGYEEGGSAGGGLTAELGGRKAWVPDPAPPHNNCDLRHSRQRLWARVLRCALQGTG